MSSSDVAPSSQHDDPPPRTPTPKRGSNPNTPRLDTIDESETPQQPSSRLRKSSSHPNSIRDSNKARRTSGNRSSQETSQSVNYTWVSEAADGETDGRVAEDREKPTQGKRTRAHRRGGWGRVAIIAALVLLVIIGLAVGLGVGLTQRHHNGGKSGSQASQPAGTTTGNVADKRFPLGEYSLVTALREQQTNCTANPATWRCYPYTVFNLSDSTMNSSSSSSFNWIISNTSTTYASNETTVKADQGIPANLTISATDNPFGISFTNESLTYISSSSNSSSPRYTFTMSTIKAVVPSPAITSDNSPTECFFNQTTLTGTLYLSAQRDYPTGELATSTGLGGYTQWPYAVEISQSSPGGQNVPNCYEIVNGVVQSRITQGLDPAPVDSECLCDYRNF